MIKVRCMTNQDNYHHETWPSEMVARPIVGDTVRSNAGKELKVCRIVHCQKSRRSHFPLEKDVGEPYLEVELTKASTWHAQQ